jgi:hypothetical protein
LFFMAQAMGQNPAAGLDSPLTWTTAGTPGWNTVPATWDGTVDGLPGGIDDVMTTSIGGYESAPAPTTLCALQAALLPGNTGQGLSTVIIRAMRDVAARRGYSALIAPVRPNQKTLYPLTPLERYITWRRPDGLPQDAWLRVHPDLPGITWSSENDQTRPLRSLDMDRRIDYVYVTTRRRDGRGTVRDARVVLDERDERGTCASDHYGVLADLIFEP